jgi:hypothetical protein
MNMGQKLRVNAVRNYVQMIPDEQSLLILIKTRSRLQQTARLLSAHDLV